MNWKSLGIAVFLAIVLFVTLASAGNSPQDKGVYQYKTFVFISINNDEQAEDAMDTVEQWLKDNKIDEHEFETAASTGIFYLTVKYRK